MLLSLLLWTALASDANAEHKAKVLVFVSARCPCSAGHEPVMRELAREFGPQGFEFEGIHSNADETAEESKTHFAAAKLGFPVTEDPQSRLADQYGANRTPHAFVVSPTGKILFQGGIDDSKVSGRAKRSYLREALEAIAAGKSVEVSEARSLGCVIRRPL